MITSWHCISAFLLVVLHFSMQWLISSLAFSSLSFCCEQKCVNDGEEIISQSPLCWRQQGEDWILQLFLHSMLTASQVFTCLSTWPCLLHEHIANNSKTLLALTMVMTGDAGVSSAYKSSHDHYILAFASLVFNLHVYACL